MPGVAHVCLRDSRAGAAGLAKGAETEKDTKDREKDRVNPLPRRFHIPRADSTEEDEPLRECANLQARNNTRANALFDTAKAVSKREAASMQTPCPRPGKP